MKKSDSTPNYDHENVRKGDHISWYNKALNIERKGQVTKVIDGDIFGTTNDLGQKNFQIYDPGPEHRIKIITPQKRRKK